MRNTFWDPFRFTGDRQQERRLIIEYAALIEEILLGLDAGNHATAVELASLPEQIRGFGPVKERHVAHAKQREADLLDAFRKRVAPERRASQRSLPTAVLVG